MKTLNITMRNVGMFLGVLALSFSIAPTASAIDLPSGFLPFMSHWTVHGWAREYASWQLQDLPETKVNDAGDLSMNRQSLYLDSEWLTGPIHWTVRARGDFEILTSLQKRLQDLTANTPAPGGRADFRNEFNRVDLREFFIDWQLTNKLHLRLGRQQVVWGQTDFFHATDVIHGYDLRWRSFLSEGQQIRKPLIMVNMTYSVPELLGSLQVLVRPGIDDDHWIGNSEPAFGGQWIPDGSHGLNLLSRNDSGLGVYNYHYRDSDVSSPDYGLRWKGTFTAYNNIITYALNYYHGHGGFYQDATVINDPAHPDNGHALQFVFPSTDTVGGSISGPINSINSVYRVEVAYTPDRHMSSDLNNNAAFTSKDAYNFVLGLDTSLYLQKYLHTSSSSVLSMQVFDWYIPDATKADEIVRFNGNGYFSKHNVIGTVAFSNPFFFENLHLGIVGLVDFTDGGGMIIPAIDYKYGTHWRLHLEVDKAMGGQYSGHPSPRMTPAGPYKNGSILGGMRDDTQFLTRVTFLF